jgi:hypothetical protein
LQRNNNFFCRHHGNPKILVPLPPPPPPSPPQNPSNFLCHACPHLVILCAAICDIQGLLACLTAQQEHRVLVYKKLNTSFQAMVRSRNFDGYQLLYQQATSEFTVISANINAVEQELQNVRHEGTTAQICNGIRTLQQFEKKKLLVTAHSQATELKHCLGVDIQGWVESKGLVESFGSHQSALASIIESINDTLEEIHCEASDL